MKSFVGLLGLFLANCMLASAGKADFFLTIETGLSFQANSGIRPVNVFLRLDPEASINFLTVDFSLESGAVFASPNAGTFGGVGYIGNENNNIDYTPGQGSSPPASSFLRDPSNPSIAVLSITFIAPQSVTATPTLLATLNIDTTNLVEGNYRINAMNEDLGGISGTSTGGSFEITAVPEPTTFLMVAVSLGGMWIGQRRLRLRLR